MRNRSGVPHHEDELDSLTAAQLEQEIARVASRLEIAGATHLRKAFFNRLVWLEAHREAVYGIPAPKRTMRARQS